MYLKTSYFSNCRNKWGVLIKKTFFLTILFLCFLDAYTSVNIIQIPIYIIFFHLVNYFKVFLLRQLFIILNVYNYHVGCTTIYHVILSKFFDGAESIIRVYCRFHNLQRVVSFNNNMLLAYVFYK